MNPTILLKPYADEDAPVWDEIVRRSCNGNFLHMRPYMDYHSDRFTDCSLMLWRGSRPVAVFPASRHEHTVTSHGGLTYGGLIHTDELATHDVLLAFEAIAAHYRRSGVSSVLYKAVPLPFHRLPSQSDLYALYRCQAQLVRRDASSLVVLAEDARFSKGRKWSVNKARKAGITVRQSNDVTSFHALLTLALKKFGTVPTHSLHELQLLRARFPAEITLHVAEQNGTLLAGTLIYDFGHIVHTQYMASSDAGRAAGALDVLLAELIRITYANRQFFSFGISTEMQGNYLNEGLIAQKEGFGARTVVHDFYQWPVQGGSLNAIACESSLILKAQEP